MTPSAESLGVSRETFDRLGIYVDGVVRWQRTINLVGASTLRDIWVRHVADSLQLLPLIVPRLGLVDIGSGGGFPGLVLAAARPECRVTLVDSDARKCAFLREMTRRVAPHVAVRRGRAEDVLPELRPPPGALTARGVAPLVDLFRLSESLLRSGTVGLFPKGRQFGAELTEAKKAWRFDVSILPSRTDPEARILRVTNLARLTDA